jgi:hypothetical protein
MVGLPIVIMVIFLNLTKSRCIVCDLIPEVFPHLKCVFIISDAVCLSIVK